MKIERMEVVGINVTDLDAAMSTFTDLLGIEFRPFVFGQDVSVESYESDVPDAATAGFAGTRIAIDPTGYLELVEVAGGAEGFRNMHLKVADLDAAKAELRAKGIRMVVDHRAGGLREAIFHPDDLHGVRLCLIEYEAPSMIEALLEE